jgi:hypothetical protein
MTEGSRKDKPMQRHEIPTHLEVEDKVMLGLTMRQVLTAAAALALAYGVAGELPLPLPARLAGAGLVLVCGALVTLWRPSGRPLEVWAFVLLQYIAAPRIAVWQADEVRSEEDGETPAAVVVQLPQGPRRRLVPDPRAARAGALRRVRDA